jgi:hypothetical protein
VGFYLAELETKHFSSGYTYSDFSLAASISYFPISWAIEPYVGIGAIYDVINLSSSGHIQFNNGLYRMPNIPKNNLAAELKGGIRFAANSPINLTWRLRKRLASRWRLFTTMQI